MYRLATCKTWEHATLQEKALFFGTGGTGDGSKSPVRKYLESPDRIFGEADFLDLEQQREFFVVPSRTLARDLTFLPLRSD